MSNDITTTNRFAFFWDRPFSHWHRAPFLLAGTYYTCCEQYMMAEKARVFGDGETLAKILAAPTPRVQKSLGRRVRNFDVDAWNSVCRGIVYTGNLAKFQKHEDLARLLLETGDRQIVEASPVDSIWGIGLAVDRPDVSHPERWPGKNWLGIALMQVRATLLDPSRSLEPELREQLESRMERTRTHESES